MIVCNLITLHNILITIRKMFAVLHGFAVPTTYANNRTSYIFRTVSESATQSET